MKFRIHFAIGDTRDSVVLEAETIEEIRDLANAELERRKVKPDDAWSEELP